VTTCEETFEPLYAISQITETIASMSCDVADRQPKKE
jgi:hypothetical protein